MKRVLYIVAVALLMTACGGKQKSNETTPKPAPSPMELSANKDAGYLESKKVKIIRPEDASNR